MTRVLAPWREWATQRGLHFSETREGVVEVVLSQAGHSDLRELYLRVRRRLPRVGLATVYRTVKMLEEAGLLAARNFSERGAVYEVTLGREHHDHLICDVCGEITEFTDAEIERLQDEVARELGFQLLRHRHELHGVCADCRAKTRA